MEVQNPYPRKSVRRNFTMCGTLFGLIPDLFLLAFPLWGGVFFMIVLALVFPLSWFAGAFIASLELYRSAGSYFASMTICGILGLFGMIPFGIIGHMSNPESAYIMLVLMGLGAFAGLMTALMTLPGKEDHSENGESP